MDTAILTIMSTNLAAELRDTFPGRLLIDWYLDWHARHPEYATVLDYTESVTTGDMAGRVRSTLSSYLWGDGFKDVLDMDTDSSEVVEMSEAIATVLTSPRCRTWNSPQYHHGRIPTLRAPLIANRFPPSSLLNGAFWTAPVFENGDDAWALHGEHNPRRSPNRYEVHFDPDAVRVAHIDTAGDWSDLLDAHPMRYGDTLFPDWPSIAARWDAVHVSVSGLLCAQPRISEVPYESGDPSGYTHSQSGPYAGVAEWTVPSTAWLRLPAECTVRVAETGLEVGRSG